MILLEVQPPTNMQHGEFNRDMHAVYTLDHTKATGLCYNPSSKQTHTIRVSNFVADSAREHIRFVGQRDPPMLTGFSRNRHPAMFMFAAVYA